MLKQERYIYNCRGIVHWIDGRQIIASKGRGLYIIDNNLPWTHLTNIPIPITGRIKLINHPCRRLFRWSVHHIVSMDGNVLLIFAFGKIFRFSLITRSFIGTSTKIVGKRPLSVCQFDKKTVLYGEYGNNEERKPIPIIGTFDGGEQWEPVYTFRGIRHIHGIYCDPYSQAIWITTGDLDGETAIWVTKDNFRTINRITGGNQQRRAIQLLFTRNHVYFGSDTPLENNYIYRIEKEKGQVEKLQDVQSSVFWGCKVGDCLFFSTAVEPSNVNKCRYACIWGSKDGENWKRISSFYKDRYPMRLFQYGQILFPSGENNTGYLWFTPLATERNMTVQRLDVNEIF